VNKKNYGKRKTAEMKQIAVNTFCKQLTPCHCSVK